MSLKTLAQDDGRVCPDYESDGSRRCRSYLDGGGCRRAEHPACEEWVRVNPGRLPDESRAREFCEKHPDYRLAVSTGVYFVKGWRARMRSLSAPSGLGISGSANAPSASEPTRPATLDEVAVRLPSEIEVASFRRLGIEVCLTSPEVGEVWLVPKYTGKDRPEITPEHALTLARIMLAFPGSTVAKFLTGSAMTPEPADEEGPTC